MDDFCFHSLTPDTVLDALESVGILVDSGLIALNSYENRVYQFVDREGQRQVVKFYRPQRWSEQQLREEHAFAADLVAAEIPVIAPEQRHGDTLHFFAPFFFAVYPSVGGYPFESDNFDQLERIGQWFGRLHQVGSQQRFAARVSLDEPRWRQDLQILREQAALPSHIAHVYWSIVADIEPLLAPAFAQMAAAPQLRLHGDAHAGNLLLRGKQLAIVDLDDAVNGPAIQDLWMFLSGERHDQIAQLDALLAGYEDFFEFDHRQLALIEPLRTQRIVHHAAWLTQRWGDPAFPRHFPWFNTDQYWEQQVLHLREQLAMLHEPPLTLRPEW